MTVLVTGAGGFVGSHLVENLKAQGKDVRCLLYSKDSNPAIDRSEFECVVGDVADEDFMRKAVRECDEIYHLAAALNHSCKDLAEFIRVNAIGTKNVMDAAMATGVKKVVHVSSRVTINENGSGRIDENHVHKGFFDNAYALSKARGEKIAMEYGAKGLPVVVINPTLIYGPRETHTIGPMIKSYLEPRIRFVGFLDTVFNLVHVRDVVGALTSAMERGRNGHRYIIGGVEISIRDFLSAVDMVVGTEKKPRVVFPNAVIEGVVSWVGPLLKAAGMGLPVAKEQIYAMKYGTLVDISKARKDLGLKVTPIEEGLRETLEWYREIGYIKT